MTFQQAVEAGRCAPVRGRSWRGDWSSGDAGLEAEPTPVLIYIGLRTRLSCTNTAR
jgi:hypothetical protein